MKRFLIFAAVVLGGWWYWRQNKGAATAANSDAASAIGTGGGGGPTINLIPGLTGGSGAGGGTGVAGLLESSTQSASQKLADKIGQAQDSWVWTGGDEPGKVVSLSEFDGWLALFGNSKCEGGDCSKLGKKCLKGYDC